MKLMSIRPNPNVHHTETSVYPNPNIHHEETNVYILIQTLTLTSIIRLYPNPLFPITLDYKSDDISLKVVKQYKYLGIILHEGMRWLHHIQSICNKANKSLNFLRRNLSKCSINVKENAYLTIVRPLLEYAACVWDPYQEYLIYDLEKIQRRAARWVLSNYNYYSSVTDMLKTLKWPTLQERRNISRLSQLHKIVHQLTPSIQLHHVS